MPLYVCTTPSGGLDDSARRRIAEQITTVHCAATGAPPTFVQVIFFEDPAAARDRYVLTGNLRAGRTDEVKRQIVDGLRRAIAAEAGVAANDVAVTTRDTPAKWIMEGGELLPEPGEEEAWLARHPAPNRVGVA
jgi:phenylpyruvate tautomerase PptA (4-oxalocrotonate tautomerase family)